MAPEPIKHRLIEIGLVEKKTNCLDRGIFLHFHIPGLTDREKTCSQKRSRFFDKLIIKNIQNELLYKNYFNQLNTQFLYVW